MRQAPCQTDNERQKHILEEPKRPFCVVKSIHAVLLGAHQIVYNNKQS